MLKLNSHPEEIVAIAGILALICYSVWALVRKFRALPTPPDPWDKTTEESIQRDDAMPICHRCLSPHDPDDDFCPVCGATVGTYTNWMPYPYLFSLGDTLRIGSQGAFKHSPLTIVGFIALSIAEYGFVAPVYWAVLARASLINPPCTNG